MDPQETIRVLVVDDHAVVRSGLIGALNAFPEFAVVGDASSGAQAVQSCEELDPDVVLMDLIMPQVSGIEATTIIRERFPQIQILVLTSFSDDELIQQALEAGATGYLLKNASIHEIANAVRAVAQNQSVLSPDVARSLIRLRTQDTPSFELKERELQVLELMAKGLTNSQIAEQLMLSKSTIKFYVSSLLEKLGVATRTEAVAFAIQHDII